VSDWRRWLAAPCGVSALVAIVHLRDQRVRAPPPAVVADAGSRVTADELCQGRRGRSAPRALPLGAATTGLFARRRRGGGGLDGRLRAGIGLTVGMQAMSDLDDLQPVRGMGEVRLVPDLDTFRVAGSRTGVFVGNANGDYMDLQLRAVIPSLFNNYRSLLPSRLSYVFDFRGPSVLVDTACSSSLVTVHSAVQSLRAGESSLALAATVHIKLLPEGRR
jgi:hypothetical protein